MSDFTVSIDLPQWRREQCARHFEQTRHMCFGGQERITANVFRVDVSECVSASPAAAALVGLAAGFRSSGPVRVKLAGFSKADKFRLSALLQQTANRPSRDGDDELALVLGGLWKQFDRQLGLTEDELTRAEHLGVDAARREAELARRENQRLKPRPVVRDRSLEGSVSV